MSFLKLPMAVFSGRIYSRANQFRGFLYFCRNAEFRNNGLSSNFVTFQCCKKFSSSQQEKPHVKESLLVNQFNKIPDSPNNESEGKLLSLLQNVNLNNRNPSRNLDYILKSLTNKNFSKDEIESVKNHPFFNDLCATLEKTFVMCTPQELYTNFRFACFFHFPESSLFIKKLLILILDKVNFMNHFQLINILLKMNIYKGETAETLKKAILTCLEYKQPLESLNFDLACFYFSKFIIPEITKKWMMQIIAENCELDWSILNWVNVIEGLKTYTIKDMNTAAVVRKIRNHLVFSLNEEWSTEHLLDVFYSLFKIHHVNCKSERLLDVLCYHLSKRNLSEFEICRALYLLIVMSHFNYSLYEKLCEKVKEKEFHQKLSENLQNLASQTLFIFSRLNFLELDKATIDDLMKCLQNVNWVNISQTQKLKNLSSMLVHLLSINIYDKSSFDIFYDLLIKDIDRINKTSIKEKYTFLLYHYLSIFHPEDKPSLPEDVVKKLKDLEMETFDSSEFKSDVESVFGGEKNVVSKCFSPEGMYFGYAVALTSDNTPMDLSHLQSSSGPVTIDPKTFPKDAKLVFIQIYNNRSLFKFLNTPIESVWKRISDKIYRKLNYNVVSLKCRKDSQLLDFANPRFWITKAFEKDFGKIQNVNQ